MTMPCRRAAPQPTADTLSRSGGAGQAAAGVDGEHNGSLGGLGHARGDLGMGGLAVFKQLERIAVEVSYAKAEPVEDSRRHLDVREATRIQVRELDLFGDGR